MTIKILLIEDNDTDSYSIKRSMSKITDVNYIFSCATTLSEAENFAIDSIDIIITDLGLPDSTSSSTYVEVELMFPNIPKIIITGREDQEFKEAMSRAGAAGYINKNKFNPQELDQIIRQVLTNGPEDGKQ